MGTTNPKTPKIVKLDHDAQCFRCWMRIPEGYEAIEVELPLRGITTFCRLDCLKRYLEV